MRWMIRVRARRNRCKKTGYSAQIAHSGPGRLLYHPSILDSPAHPMKTMYAPRTTLPLTLLLSLTAALSGCGGAADEPGTATPPSGPISVDFTRPTVEKNVLDVGGSADVYASVGINGSTPPDGTIVTFAVSPASAATLAPVAPTSVSGLVATTLRSSLLAGSSFELRASATSSANSDSETLNFHVRPAPGKLQLLVPAYSAASSGAGAGTASPWTTLTSGAASYPDVKITAIANPHNGILTATTAADSSLTTAIDTFKAVANTSNQVMAYVATAAGSSGALSVTDVKASIDRYLALYPGKFDGFFLDTMATGSDRLAFFTDLYNHIKGRNANLIVIGNPGTYPDPAYADVTDVLVTYAGNAAAYQGINPQPLNTWVYKRPNSAQAMLVHSASTCTAMKNTLAMARQPRMNTGLIYITDLTLGASWAGPLATYWTQMLGTVDALNNPGRSEPAC